MLQQQIEMLEREVEDIPPQQKPAAPVIVQQEFLSESKRAKLRALQEPE